MKNHIFIAIHYLEIGGAEMSLIGLLQSFDYDKIDVDLFIYRHQGELLAMIPKEVNLLPEIPLYAQIESPIKETFHEGNWQIAYDRLKAKLEHKRFVKRNHPVDDSAIFGYIAKNVTPHLPDINSDITYDLAISFLTPHNIVLQKVNAKKKACWIHTDYTKVAVNADLELPIWGGYDYIVSISEEVTSSFLKVFPTLKNKIVLIENILSERFVRERANLSDVSILSGPNHPAITAEKNKPIILLSVGRFSYAKNYDNVPDICRRIVEKGIDVRWHLIGYGCDEAFIRQKITETGMEDRVIILGKRTNPYPYIKACDIYVQPSRYEGKSVTVREAQILCKPVVVTNYTTAPSQVNDGVDGVIVSMENECCAKEIAAFIKNKELQSQIIDYLQTHHYGNESEIEKIYQLCQV